MKLWISALLAIFALAHTALAQEQEYPAYNFAITPPEGWVARTNPSAQKAVVALFGNPANTRLLLLMAIDEKKDAGILDDRFVTNFEKGVEHSGSGPRISGKFIEVQGLKGYERLGGFMKGGKYISTITRVVLINGRSYSLMGMRSDGDANNALDIQTSFTTFRFLTPPEPPRPSAQSAAYHIGYVIGQNMIYIIPVMFVILLVVVITVSIQGKKSRRHAATPPPLPPIP